MKEICICAAVKSVDGVIIRGHRHRDCVEGVIRRGMKPDKDFYAYGFITSKNRYVDREEGFVLQINARIKSANPEGYNSAGWLFTEDIY